MSHFKKNVLITIIAVGFMHSNFLRAIATLTTTRIPHIAAILAISGIGRICWLQLIKSNRKVQRANALFNIAKGLRDKALEHEEITRNTQSHSLGPLAAAIDDSLIKYSKLWDAYNKLQSARNTRFIFLAGTSCAALATAALVIAMLKGYSPAFAHYE